MSLLSSIEYSYHRLSCLKHLPYITKIYENKFCFTMILCAYKLTNFIMIQVVLITNISFCLSLRHLQLGNGDYLIHLVQWSKPHNLSDRLVFVFLLFLPCMFAKLYLWTFQQLLPEDILYLQNVTKVLLNMGILTRYLFLTSSPLEIKTGSSHKRENGVKLTDNKS